MVLQITFYILYRLIVKNANNRGGNMDRTARKCYDVCKQTVKLEEICMKWARFLLTIPVLLLSIVFGYLYWGAHAEIAVNVQTAPAQAHSATYDSVVAAVQTGAAEAVYSTEAFTGAQDYTLVSTQVTMRNPGALPMEWVSCAYVPAGGDVALYEIEGLPADIGSQREITFFVRTICKNGTDVSSPALRITYYVAGQELVREIGG